MSAPDTTETEALDRAAVLIRIELREAAGEVDSGPTFPIPPSVLSALLRERADRIGGGDRRG